jgi:hypothetical protein
MIDSKLETIFLRATHDQIKTGVEWYKDAYIAAQKLAKEFDIPIFKVAGVIAALSPNNKWERNLYDTRLFLQSPSLETKVCTFMGQRRKALMILNCKSSSGVRLILSGRKTVSFFDNITKHDVPHKVTVDLWMYRMAELKQSHKNYEIISQAVIELSEKHKVLPHQFQAIVWSVVRPNKGTK